MIDRVNAVESIRRVLTVFLSDPKTIGTGPIMMTPAVLVLVFLPRATIRIEATMITSIPMNRSANPTVKRMPASNMHFLSGKF